MINTQPVEFPGIQEVLDNSDFYKQKLLDDSIIVFRNANLTNDDQSFFHAELGKLFNYSIIKKEEDKTDNYIENHSARELMGIAGASNILLPWHIEHLYYKNPIVISTWNMTKFTTDSENGKTYFIDSEKAYNAMPEIWKSFLNLCKINHHSVDASVDDFSPVVNHWISGNPLIRLAPRKDEGSGSTLKSVDNREATQTEKDLFEVRSQYLLTLLKLKLSAGLMKETDMEEINRYLF